MRQSMALQSKFMPRHSVQPVRASMPQQEEYTAAGTEAEEKMGRREVMGTFTRAAALGAVAAATKDRAAVAADDRTLTGAKKIKVTDLLKKGPNDRTLMMFPMGVLGFDVLQRAQHFLSKKQKEDPEA